MPRAAILGLSGLDLTEAERDFFHHADPLGFILFARNCETPDQIRSLVVSLREAVGRDDAPVLIDQEGGAVARLRPPHWREAPPAEKFGALWDKNPADAQHAARLNAQLIGMELIDLGITVDCAPVLDIPVKNADAIIGNRAFGSEPERVCALGAAFCLGLMDVGVLPIIKHIPGHGRATNDSHKALPLVDTERAVLQQSDFIPFAAIARAAGKEGIPMPWAMTAHVVFTDIDPDHPATLSKTVIETVIRGDIGFGGILISDDLSMNALSGPMGQRAIDAIQAGCDLNLHCNGDMMEMVAVVTNTPEISTATAEKLAQSSGIMGQPPVGCELEGVEAELNDMLETLGEDQ
ncbi:MAG: beta-N-acetylhexosaminidase [Rhodospirillales bacterium]|jgi:beta-N-acetylhexosaminidase|nr:beta-N-acetylhexosaminidase [Rhodospirillales bacterium]MBT4006996.1 beta-N-acetylhexosaminidase [Rhodospirillales bacterium]MBT5112856.1 beta-N-acetylhexosaminidase [Rhodospirillales bacterium]MBT5673627.1 beta-N-acetylhexosaminidase [Rhodospirillales bacterium]MBT6186285.1 beta-N-acetylhexosaminidase [Rhodospirillales bacterium]